MAKSSLPPQLEVLPGMPDTPLIAAEPDARRALAALLRPERQGLQSADYADITPAMIAAADPDALRPSIFDAQEPGQASLYFRGDDHRTHTVTASDQEFNLLAGNLMTLGNRAAGSVRQHHLGDQAGRQAGVRGGVHAVTNRAEATATFLHKTLEPELTLIDDLAWAAAHPGFARSDSKEAELQKQVHSFSTLVVGRLLQAVGNQRGWTSQQAALAQRTVDRRMFIDRADNRHIDYFARLVHLARERDEALRAVTQTRLHQAAKYITEHLVDNAN